jgi:hypothetical protein
MMIIPIYERVQNIWLRKILYEREYMVRKYWGKWASEDVLNERKKRFEKLNRIIKQYGE